MIQQPASLDKELDRLFFLSWQGRGAWRPGRPDRGQQPSREALEAVLLYMREAINLYAADEPAVWPLPRYASAPTPSLSPAEQQRLVNVAAAAEED